MDDREQDRRAGMAESELDRRIYEGDDETWGREIGPYYAALVDAVVAHVEELPDRYAVRVEHHGAGFIDDPRWEETVEIDHLLSVLDESSGAVLLRLGTWAEWFVLRVGALYTLRRPLCACGICGMERRGAIYADVVDAIAAFAGGVRELVIEQEPWSSDPSWWEVGPFRRPPPETETVWLVEGADWSWEWVLDADHPLVLAATGPVVAPPWPLRSPTD